MCNNVVGFRFVERVPPPSAQKRVEKLSVKEVMLFLVPIEI